MATWIRWWRYWEVWRVFLICLIAMGIAFVSVYFLPNIYGLIILLIICAIARLLLKKYFPDMVNVLIEDVERKQ